MTNDHDLPDTADETPHRRTVEATDGSQIIINAPGDAMAADYHRIEPPNAPYDEYNTAQRRAVLLQRIERVGHPSALNKSYQKIGDEFGVSKSTIHRDLAVLGAWCAENVERDHVTIMDSVFRGAVLELVEDGEYLEAVEAGKEWFDWLAQMGAIDRVPDKLDLDATVRQASTESEDYEVLDEAEVRDLREPGADEDGDGSGAGGGTESEVSGA